MKGRSKKLLNRICASVLATVMAVGSVPAQNVFAAESSASLTDTTAANVTKVLKYAKQMLEANIEKAASATQSKSEAFSWDTEGKTDDWRYYNGVMIDAFLMAEGVDSSVRGKDFADTFYEANIGKDGTVTKYHAEEVDSVPPANGMFMYLDGTAGSGSDSKYEAAIQNVFNQLDTHTILGNCGNNFHHKLTSPSWTTWKFGLDGIYMASPFVVKCANAIEEGKLTLKSAKGNVDATKNTSSHTVKADDLYEATYQRISFIADHMQDAETGLYHHGVQSDGTSVNGHFWSRGIGWYAVALVDIIEMMPADKGSVTLDNGTSATYRQALIEDLIKLFDGMLPWQDANTGMWYNVVNRDATLTSNNGNKLETSGSAMMAYALMKAFNNGWVGASYGQAGLKAFNGIVNNKVSGSEGSYTVKDVYVSSGVCTDDATYCKNAYEADEAKGTGALIMAATVANTAAKKLDGQLIGTYTDTATIAGKDAVYGWTQGTIGTGEFKLAGGNDGAVKELKADGSSADGTVSNKQLASAEKTTWTIAVESDGTYTFQVTDGKSNQYLQAGTAGTEAAGLLGDGVSKEASTSTTYEYKYGGTNTLGLDTKNEKLLSDESGAAESITFNGDTYTGGISVRADSVTYTPTEAGTMYLVVGCAGAGTAKINCKTSSTTVTLKDIPTDSAREVSFNLEANETVTITRSNKLPYILYASYTTGTGEPTPATSVSKNWTVTSQGEGYVVSTVVDGTTYYLNETDGVWSASTTQDVVYLYSQTTVTEEVPAKKVSFAATSAEQINMTVGATQTIGYEVTLTNAKTGAGIDVTSKNITWTSEADNVAGVTVDGDVVTVTAKAAGDAYIVGQLTEVNGDSCSATIRIPVRVTSGTVEPAPEPTAKPTTAPATPKPTTAPATPKPTAAPSGATTVTDKDVTVSGMPEAAGVGSMTVTNTTTTATDTVNTLKEQYTDVSLYEIKLFDSSKKEITSFNSSFSATVKLPIPSGDIWKDTTKILAYDCKEGKTIQGSAADGYYTFTVTHFSSYALVTTATVAEEPVATAKPSGSTTITTGSGSGTTTYEKYTGEVKDMNGDFLMLVGATRATGLIGAYSGDKKLPILKSDATTGYTLADNKVTFHGYTNIWPSGYANKVEDAKYFVWTIDGSKGTVQNKAAGLYLSLEASSNNTSTDAVTMSITKQSNGSYLIKTSDGKRGMKVDSNGLVSSGSETVELYQVISGSTGSTTTIDFSVSPETLDLKAGTTGSIVPVVKVDGVEVSSYEITWSSDDETKATVSAGTVTAVAAGNTAIRAILTKAGGHTLSSKNQVELVIPVTVSAPAPTAAPATPVPTAKPTVVPSGDWVKLEAGSTAYVKTTDLPANVGESRDYVIGYMNKENLVVSYYAGGTYDIEDDVNTGSNAAYSYANDTVTLKDTTNKYIWTITKVDGGYTVCNKGSGKYVSLVSNKNGEITSGTATTLSITPAETVVIKNTETNFYLMYKNSSMYFGADDRDANAALGTLVLYGNAGTYYKAEAETTTVTVGSANILAAVQNNVKIYQATDAAGTDSKEVTFEAAGAKLVWATGSAPTAAGTYTAKVMIGDIQIGEASVVLKPAATGTVVNGTITTGGQGGSIWKLVDGSNVTFTSGEQYLIAGINEGKLYIMNYGGSNKATAGTYVADGATAPATITSAVEDTAVWTITNSGSGHTVVNKNNTSVYVYANSTDKVFATGDTPTVLTFSGTAGAITIKGNRGIKLDASNNFTTSGTATKVYLYKQVTDDVTATAQVSFAIDSETYKNGLAMEIINNTNDTHTVVPTVKVDGVATDTYVIQWSSSNTGVATVDANGKITTVSAGDATITATLVSANGKKVDGNGITLTIPVTVTNAAASYSYEVVVSANPASIYVGEQSTVTASLVIKDGSGKTVKVTPSSYKITWGYGNGVKNAKESGWNTVVTGASSTGTATATATVTEVMVNGVEATATSATATATLTVQDKYTYAVETAAQSVSKGESVTVTPTVVLYKNGVKDTTKTFDYALTFGTPSNDNVTLTSSTGTTATYTGAAAGTADVMVTVSSFTLADGSVVEAESTKTSTFTIQVKETYTYTVSVVASKTDLYVGDTATITAKLEVKDSNGKVVEPTSYNPNWKSTNGVVAESVNGFVNTITGVKAGTSDVTMTITEVMVGDVKATAAENYGYARVTVKDKYTYTLSAINPISMAEGEKVTVTPVVLVYKNGALVADGYTVAYTWTEPADTGIATAKTTAASAEYTGVKAGETTASVKVNSVTVDGQSAQASGTAARSFKITVSSKVGINGWMGVTTEGTTTYYKVDGNALSVPAGTTAEDAVEALKASDITISKSVSADGTDAVTYAWTEKNVTTQWVDTYNANKAGTYVLNVLVDGEIIGQVGVKVSTYRYELTLAPTEASIVAGDTTTITPTVKVWVNDGSKEELLTGASYTIHWKTDNAFASVTASTTTSTEDGKATVTGKEEGTTVVTASVSEIKLGDATIIPTSGTPATCTVQVTPKTTDGITWIKINASSVSADKFVRATTIAADTPFVITKTATGTVPVMMLNTAKTDVANSKIKITANSDSTYTFASAPTLWYADADGYIYTKDGDTRYYLYLTGTTDLAIGDYDTVSKITNGAKTSKTWTITQTGSNHYIKASDASKPYLYIKDSAVTTQSGAITVTLYQPNSVSTSTEYAALITAEGFNGLTYSQGAKTYEEIIAELQSKMTVKHKASENAEATVVPWDDTRLKLSFSPMLDEDTAGVYTATVTFDGIELGSTTVTIKAKEYTFGIAITEDTIALTKDETKDLAAMTTVTAVKNEVDVTDTISTTEIIWSSDNEAVAKVDKDGKVTVVANGTANITATLVTVTVNGVTDAMKVSDVSDSVKITVTGFQAKTLAYERETRAVSALSTGENYLIIWRKGSATPGAIVFEGAVSTTNTATITEEDIASVTGDLLNTAVWQLKAKSAADGQYVLYRNNNGSTEYLTCTNKAYSVTTTEADATTITITEVADDEYGTLYRLSYTYNSKTYYVKCNSSGWTVATSTGQDRLVRLYHETEIETLSATLGTDKSNVTLKTGVTPSDDVNTQVSIMNGAGEDITEQCTDTIDWSVANSNIATVTKNSDGTATVNAVAPGSTTVTATLSKVTYNGKTYTLNKSVTIPVTVTSPTISKIVLNETYSINVRNNTELDLSKVLATITYQEKDTNGNTLTAVVSAANGLAFDTSKVDLTKEGTYTVTVKYGNYDVYDAAGGSVTVNVGPYYSLPQASAYPEYPDKGAVRINKGASSSNFFGTGVAKVQLDVAGVSTKQNVDVILVVDVSNSMAWSDNWFEGKDATYIANATDADKIPGKETITAEDGTVTETYKPDKLDQAMEAAQNFADILLKNNSTAAGAENNSLSFVTFSSYDAQSNTAAQSYIDSVQTVFSNETDVNAAKASFAATKFTKYGVGGDKVTTTLQIGDTEGNALATGTNRGNTNYDYAFGQANAALNDLYDAYGSKEAYEATGRQAVVVFMTDGAPSHYNGVRVAGKSSSDALFGTTKAYANSSASASAWLKEIKKTNTYAKALVDNGIDGMYAIGFDLAHGGFGNYSWTESELGGVLISLAGENMPVDVSLATNAADLATTFNKIATQLKLAGTYVTVTDVIKDYFTLQRGSVIGNGTENQNTAASDIVVTAKTLWTQADVDAGLITADQIGYATGEEEILETVSFNAAGTEAYTSLNGAGNTTNIMTIGSDGTVVINATYFTYTKDVDGKETFVWKYDNITDKAMVLSYYVYLKGSFDDAEVPKTENNQYPTNEYAIVEYVDVDGSYAKQTFPVPTMNWGSASTRIVFYYVNENGQPVNSNGQVVSIANAKFLTGMSTTVSFAFDMNNPTTKIIGADYLPAGYTMYNPSAYYEVYSSTNEGVASYLNITDDKTVNGEAGTMSTQVVVHEADYSSSTVIFGVLQGQLPEYADNALAKDQVVLDYSKPVTIDVLANDTEFAGVKYHASDVEYVEADHLYKLAAEGAVTGLTAYSANDTANIIFQEGKASTVQSIAGKYGTFTITDNKITYEMTGFMSGIDRANVIVKLQSANGAVIYVRQVLEIIPATTMYYEDDFSNVITYTAKGDTSWTTKGTADADSQDYQAIAEDTFGYDSSYATDAQYSDGTANTVTGSGAITNTEAAFSFHGTGFDLISYINKDQGQIRVDVYADEACTDRVKRVFVRNQTSIESEELYQIPVVSIEDLDCADYYVKVNVYAPVNNTGANAVFNHGGQFAFDAVRIYNSAADAPAADMAVIHAAYAEAGEANAIVTEVRENLLSADSFNNGGFSGIGFVTVEEVKVVEATAAPDSSTNTATGSDDTTTENKKNWINGSSSVEVTLTDYKNYGPNNEVYLTKGQGIAFKLEGLSSEVKSIDIGAKSANGTPVTLKASIYKDTDSVADNNYEVVTLQQNIQTSTAMFYDLTKAQGFNAANLFEKGYVYVIITNAGDNGILSITDIKLAYGDEDATNAEAGISFEESTLENVAFFLAAPVEKNYDVQSAQFTAEAAKLSEEITLNVVTSNAVEELVITGFFGMNVKPVRATYVEVNGVRNWTVVMNPELLGNRTYTITGYGANGTMGAAASAEIKITL